MSSAYEETLVLCRPVRDADGYIEDVETFEEYEAWMDEQWGVEEGDPLVSHEEVETFLGAVCSDLDEFVELPASLVERLQEARDEYGEVLAELCQALDALEEDE